MKIKNLKASAIITTKDFPVHNLHILKIYFRICKHGHHKVLPPTPVIPISVGLPLLNEKTRKAKEYNNRIREYLAKNRNVRYFMVDGSHKTTALTLAHKPIHAMLLKTNKDIKEFKDLVELGEVFSMMGKETIRKELDDLARHFKDAEFFETVEEKTKRMVKKRVIPGFMIEYYKNKKRLR